MKILLVGAGADFSVKDVEVGYRDAFKVAGHEIIAYNLSRRLDVAGRYLNAIWRTGMKARGEPKPNNADIIYQASLGILERALRFDVDWVVAVSAMYLHPDALIMLRRAGKRVAVLFTESPYDDEQQAKVANLCDVVFTCERSSARKYGWEYLPHAFDPKRHYPAEPDERLPAHDVVFVGTGFQERVDILSAVNWDGIDLGLYGTWVLLGSRHHLRKYLKDGAISNDHAIGLYRRAKIGLNLYRTSKGFGYGAPRVTDAESLNPRALELAACGVFQISDYRPEVQEVFGGIGGCLVPTFKTADELSEALRFWLHNQAGIDARENTCRILPAAVRFSTFDARARQVIETLGRFDLERMPSVLEFDNGIDRRQFVGQLVK